MNKALIIGKGRSGKAAEAVLRAHGHDVAFAEDCDLVVTSPGVHVMSELEFGCRELKRRGWKLLAITGSKGKSSVVKLVADTLGGIPCGNYGRPVSDLVNETPGWAVVEASSFQMETTNLAPDTFEAAAILNLQADHLDRHGCIETYHALKRRLLDMAKVAITPECLARLAAMPETKALLADSYFDNDILRVNGAAGIALLRVAGLNERSIADGFARFEPLPHRMQIVGTFNGVTCIDDSKATSMAALAAGLVMAGANTRLIAGGLAKGDDPKDVLPHLTNGVKKVYLIGSSAEKLFNAWSGFVDCEICETLDRAVEVSMREAAKGEKLLLSPGTASFDQFKSFEERGETFARLVKKSKGQKER